MSSPTENCAEIASKQSISGIDMLRVALCCGDAHIPMGGACRRLCDKNGFPSEQGSRKPQMNQPGQKQAS
jgi:hypothetical protein